MGVGVGVGLECCRGTAEAGQEGLRKTESSVIVLLLLLVSGDCAIVVLVEEEEEVKGGLTMIRCAIAAVTAFCAASFAIVTPSEALRTFAASAAVDDGSPLVFCCCSVDSAFLLGIFRAG